MPRKIRGFLAKYRKENRRGVALIEFALLLPILLVVLGGIVDFARAYMELQLLANAASEATRMAIISSDPSVTEAAVIARAKSFFADDPGGTAVNVSCGGCGSPPLGTSGDIVSVKVSRNFEEIFLGFLSGLPFIGDLTPIPSDLSYTASGRRM